MIKLITKTTLLTLLVCCTTFMAKAQLGYNYSQFDVGASLGVNQFSGEASPTSSKQSVNLNLTFNATPFTNFVLEAQLGKFAGGDSTKTPGLQFTSSFSAYVFRGQLQFGEFLDYSKSPFLNVVKNFYISGGAGYLVSHVTSISKAPAAEIIGLGIGQSRSQEPFIPFRIGYEFKLFNRYQQPSFKVDIGYTYNFIFSDAPDGYTYANSKDAYTQFSIGVKFAIGGGIVSYRKQIEY